jgi:hypothetical protein
MVQALMSDSMPGVVRMVRIAASVSFALDSVFIDVPRQLRRFVCHQPS